MLCSGPGCEDFYASARLSLLPAIPSEEPLDVWADTEGRLDGLALEGSGWVTAPVEDGLLIGQPDYVQDGVAVGRVVLVATPTATGPVVPLAQWVNDEGGVTEFGASVSAQPSVEGKGYDLWVGAPGHDYGRGAVYLFRNADAGGRNASERDLVLLSETPNDRLGTRIFPCADLTGDGLPELAIAAPWFATPASWSIGTEGQPIDDAIPPLAGAVFLVRSDQVVEKGGGEWAPWDVSRVWWGDTVGEGAGTAVACDRDLDGDTIVDVVIGSPWSEGSRGHVTVVSAPEVGGSLPPSGPLSEVEGRRTITGPPDTQDWFGVSLATLGIAEGAVLAVGGAGFDVGAGQVHLYDGADLADAEPGRFASFESDPDRRGIPDHFGRWLYAGDLDGDGQSDLVVGAPDYKADGRNAFDAGHLWIWYGADRDQWQISGTTDGAGLEIGGDEPFARIGRAVTVADTDGDEIDELWVPTGVATER